MKNSLEDTRPKSCVMEHMQYNYGQPSPLKKKIIRVFKTRLSD